MSRGGPGTPLTFRRPVHVAGVRETKSQALGSTSGAIAAWGITVITATATGLVYTLPAPTVGAHKRVVLDYTGATGALLIATPTSADFLNGSTHNALSVSSSEQHGVFDFIGMSTSAWSVNWSVTPNTASTAGGFVPGITFVGTTKM